jgi:hypothetical protein
MKNLEIVLRLVGKLLCSSKVDAQAKTNTGWNLGTMQLSCGPTFRNVHQVSV